jgi:prophage antirepressor-like protein
MKNQTMTQPQMFYDSEFGALEVLLLDDKPFFPATECAEILGYKNPQKAIRDHCRWVNVSFTHPDCGEAMIGSVTRTVIDRLGREQEKKYISEGDLYRLIIRSKLPSAERFERWVFDLVLPTIRKYGAFATSDTLDELLRNPKFAEVLINELAEERELNAALSLKADYYDKVMVCNNLIPVSVIAKDYGMAAAPFNELLHDLGVQYKIGGCWLLYQKYADNGYTRTRTYYYGAADAAMHTCWTHKGRQFLHEFLSWYGIMPIAVDSEVGV